MFIITEQKWSLTTLITWGLSVRKWWMKKPVNWIGTDSSYFNNNFDYIEQITDYINELLDAQEKGELEYDLLFLWDSVGSVPCKMTFDGKGGKQHNAAHLRIRLVWVLTKEFRVHERRL